MSADQDEIVIARADPADPDIAALIAAHVERSRRYYPEDSCHTYGPAEMEAEGVRLFAARISGEAVAIGGLKPLGAEAEEVKSMHTARSWRGRGIGSRLIERLMAEARDLGWSALYLETGSDAGSAAARAVYMRLGFLPCGPFGPYTDDPLSIFMTRPL